MLWALPPDTPKHPPIGDFWLSIWLLQFMGDKLKNVSSLQKIDFIVLQKDY